MVAWPALLPQEQFIGLSEKRQKATVRSSILIGEPNQRKRFSAVSRNITSPLTINGAERLVFDGFWISDLAEGVLTFTWEDPVTDVTVTFRFVSEPEFKLIAGGIPDERIWNVTLQLEILP